MRVLGHTLAALRDEQRKSREALERRLDVLFQQADDGMLVFDGRGDVRHCNPKIGRLFGTTPEAMVGQQLLRWIAPPPGTPAGGALPLGKWEADLPIATAPDQPTSHVPVEISMHALAEAEGEQFFCLVRDISERRLAEQHMTRLAKFDSLTGLPNRSLFRDRLLRRWRARCATANRSR